MTSALISASVAIFIAVLNHFIVTPIKERQNRKREQLKNLYAPLYGILVARTNIAKNAILQNKRILLASRSEKHYLDGVVMEEFILKNSGYCSTELLEAWTEYVSQFGGIEKKITDNLVMTAVKEYNKLKKDLNLPYNKEELRTGVPENIKQLREFNY